MQRAIAEILDRRVMLAASLAGSTLSIDSGDDNTVIIVGLNKRFANVVTIWENDQAIANYSVSAFSSIHILTGAGDDKIWIDSALDPLAYATTITTGDGNDMITTGAGNDVVDAGEGDDKVYTNAGDDIIALRGGRDSLWAGPGNDDMNGGIGNDRINGEDGNDKIEGGKGNDVITGGAGDDTINDIAGVDSIAGGDGRDFGIVYGTGVVALGPGDDGFSAPGGAQLFGEEGNDALSGSRVDGGASDDTIYGTAGADELHGGAGNDLIYGEGGNDSLIGDAGDDAIYGGAGNDKLDGGDGNDNLYGTEGYSDTNKGADGHDTAFGDAGSDWFETDYQWGRTDRNKYDQPVNTQNYIVIDPSGGKYSSGSFYDLSEAGGSASFGSSLVNNSNLFGSVTTSGGSLVKNWWNGVPLDASKAWTTVQTKSLGVAGWLSSGVYDNTSKAFMPPALSHKDRLAVGRVMLKLPPDWKIGGMTSARDDIAWYQIYHNGAAPPSEAGRSVAYYSESANIDYFGPDELIVATQEVDLTVNGTVYHLKPGRYHWDGSTISPFAEPTYPVATLDGSTANVLESTPHLYDGVDTATYRFLAVKRGSIVVSGANSDVSEPTFCALNAPVLAVRPNADVWLAGSSAIYRVATSYDTLPTGGPKKLRGIAVVGGAIWLPTDGTEPYFSSGR